MMAGSPVSFYSEDINFAPEHAGQLADWLVNAAQSENINLGDLTYIFCSDEYLLNINREHLDHDYYTDVITFSLSEDPVEANVFISIDRVRENAQIYGQAFETELHRVMVHGLLHLMGYQDKTPEEASVMRLKEEHYLEQRNFI